MTTTQDSTDTTTTPLQSETPPPRQLSPAPEDFPEKEDDSEVAVVTPAEEPLESPTVLTPEQEEVLEEVKRRVSGIELPELDEVVEAACEVVKTELCSGDAILEEYATFIFDAVKQDNAERSVQCAYAAFSEGYSCNIEPQYDYFSFFGSELYWEEVLSNIQVVLPSLKLSSHHVADAQNKFLAEKQIQREHFMGQSTTSMQAAAGVEALVGCITGLIRQANFAPLLYNDGGQVNGNV